jgi:hypothetical protein
MPALPFSLVCPLPIRASGQVRAALACPCAASALAFRMLARETTKSSVQARHDLRLSLLLLQLSRWVYARCVSDQP